MHKFIVLYVILFTFIIIISFAIAQGTAVKATLSFAEVVDNLDLTKHTSLAVKNYWKEIKGSEVTWKGTIHNVQGGRGKAKILVANKVRETYKGYNIVLVTYDLDAAAKLELHQDITFTGYIYNYKSRKGNPIIIYLDDVIVLNAADKK